MVVSFCGYFYIICPANSICRLLGLDMFPVCRPLCFFCITTLIAFSLAYAYLAFSEDTLRSLRISID